MLPQCPYPPDHPSCLIGEGRWRPYVTLSIPLAALTVLHLLVEGLLLGRVSVPTILVQMTPLSALPRDAVMLWTSGNATASACFPRLMFPQRGDGKNPTRWMSHPILESASFLLQKSQERHHLKAKHSLYVLSHQRHIKSTWSC